MKLYTEEQVIDAITKSFLAEYPKNGNDILKQLTPIELPSDEEIEESETDSPYDRIDEYIYGFIDGANWTKQFMLNQNK